MRLLAPVVSDIELARLDHGKQRQRLGAVNGLHHPHLLPKFRLSAPKHPG